MAAAAYKEGDDRVFVILGAAPGADHQKSLRDLIVRVLQHYIMHSESISGTTHGKAGRAAMHEFIALFKATFSDGRLAVPNWGNTVDAFRSYFENSMTAGKLAKGSGDSNHSRRAYVATIKMILNSKLSKEDTDVKVLNAYLAKDASEILTESNNLNAAGKAGAAFIMAAKADDSSADSSSDSGHGGASGSTASAAPAAAGGAGASAALTPVQLILKILNGFILHAQSAMNPVLPFLNKHGLSGIKKMEAYKATFSDSFPEAVLLSSTLQGMQENLYLQYKSLKTDDDHSRKAYVKAAIMVVQELLDGKRIGVLDAEGVEALRERAKDFSIESCYTAVSAKGGCGF